MAHESILIVEDEPLAARYVQILLERLHYTVVGTAATGEDAIDLVRSGKPDLILMDIDLGKGMDGTQAARLILRDRAIPILFLSSHIEEEIVEKTEADKAKFSELFGG